jgi:hypothetical protein
MAKQPSARDKNEQEVLDHIGGRGEPAPASAAGNKKASAKAARIGWMGITGSILWAACFGGAGLVAWLVFANGG